MDMVIIAALVVATLYVIRALDRRAARRETRRAVQDAAAYALATGHRSRRRRTH